MNQSEFRLSSRIVRISQLWHIPVSISTILWITTTHWKSQIMNLNKNSLISSLNLRFKEDSFLFTLLLKPKLRGFQIKVGLYFIVWFSFKLLCLFCLLFRHLSLGKPYSCFECPPVKFTNQNIHLLRESCCYLCGAFDGYKSLLFCTCCFESYHPYCLMVSGRQEYFKIKMDRAMEVMHFTLKLHFN